MRVRRRTDNVVINDSGIASGSGNPSNNGCALAWDDTVPLTSPELLDCSEERWISFNARRRGLAIIDENPARADSTFTANDVTMLEAAVRSLASCRFIGLLFAHDPNLYEAERRISLSDYARVISNDDR